jgi:two-component system sensor histidine kinase/response regulator
MGQKHILIVEDDEALLNGVRDLLEVEGYKVSSASDGVAALKLLESLPQRPDLIVSDIRMPNMDGYELLSQVRSRYEWMSIPFIFLTARGEKEDIRFGKLHGVDDYIVKPFDFKDLLVSVQACLTRYSMLNTWQESRMEALKRQIIVLLNHEFRTPLQFIVAYADLMASTPTLAHSEELREYVDGILVGGERLSRLVESFLTLVELESGYGSKVYEQRKGMIVNLGELVLDAMKGLQYLIAERGVEVELDIDKALPPIVGDRVYLGIAFRHLIENAIKFSPKNRQARVHVALSADGGYVSFSVQDWGQGVPPEELDRLFELFYQFSRDQYEQQGVGAGLAIVRHVANLHGGRIEAESQVNQGSCFRLLIPAHNPSET